MATNPNIQQPTRLLVILLTLVLLGFASIIASQFIVQRLSQKTSQLAADNHAQIHLARQLEMLIRELQADFFLLPTLHDRTAQKASEITTQSHISKALKTLATLEHGGSITPPEGIALLFTLPPQALFTFTPSKTPQLLSITKDIQDLLLLIQQDLSRIDLLLVIQNSVSTKNRQETLPIDTSSLETILLHDRDLFANLRGQAAAFITACQQLLDNIQKESTQRIRRYKLIGFLVAGMTFILVAFLGSRLIIQIITTDKILRITRDNMASDYKKQKALNTILAIGHEPLALKETLAKSLDIILKSLSANTLNEGAIFLCDHSRQKIVPQVHQGMHKNMQCLKKDCSFGTCLCSIAAVSGEIIECDSDDPRHRINYDGMPTHNHFCLPITVEEKTLGVLLIHLEKDIALPQSDKTFLIAVAHSMAALIRHQKAEEKLAKSELDRMALFESSNEAILLLRNNEIIQCNKAAAQLFCLKSPGEIISASPTGLLAPNNEGASIQTFLSLITIAMQQGTAHSECLMKRRDESTFEAALTFTPILLYGTNILYLVVRDISAKKEEEQALLSAKRQAENASRAKSNFLAAMSHEIRTPLTAILGITHLTLNKTLDSEIHENVETIHTAADSLLALINDILDVTKIEEGQLLLEESSFSTREITNKLTAIFAEQFRCAHVGFTMEIARDTPLHLVGDALRISQILNNILTNALKFTKEGEVTVTLSSPYQDTKNAVIQFAVKDSGIGISEDTLPLIFDEFTQARSARQFGGLGLGLAISKKLADIMGGKLWATSIPHQGSTFFFEVKLPLATRQNTPNDDKSGSRGFFPKTEALQGARILVVEDNDINRKVVIQILETLGALPDYASNGREAVEKIHNQYQAVLMDIEMPVLDGIQATREIRRNSQFADIPIIAMTAHAMVDDRIRCLEAGMNDYLTKPIESAHFIDVLEKWLDPERKKILSFGKAASVKNTPAPYQTTLPYGVILDIGTGIAKMGGNKDLYHEILADFLTLHRETCAKIGTALAQGNREEAHATAHLLKGVAATLRAYDLQVRAKDMEQLLRQGSEDEAALQQALTDLTTAANHLISRIKEMLGEK
jgi:PAS domain S-box-containing protein